MKKVPIKIKLFITSYSEIDEAIKLAEEIRQKNPEEILKFEIRVNKKKLKEQIGSR